MNLFKNVDTVVPITKRGFEKLFEEKKIMWCKGLC
jgi:hypothetical protein